MDLPENGFNKGGGGAEEEAGEIGHDINGGIHVNLEVRAARNDGGDFGEVDFLEDCAGVVQGDFRTELVEELLKSESCGPAVDDAEEEDVDNVTTTRDKYFQDEVDRDDGEADGENAPEAGIFSGGELGKTEDQTGSVNGAENEIAPGDEAGDAAAKG